MQPVRVKQNKRATFPEERRSFQGLTFRMLALEPSVADPTVQTGQPTSAAVTRFCPLLMLTGRHPT